VWIKREKKKEKVECKNDNFIFKCCVKTLKPPMYNFEKHYNLTKEIFDKNKDRILCDINKSKYPKSNKALFYCQEKIDNFLLTIEALTDEKYFYSTSAMTRIVFEHYLVGHYIWLKTRLEKNDTCGEQYYEGYFISECFKRLGYNIKIEGIKTGVKAKGTLDDIKIKFPKYQELTQQELDEYHRVGNQFALVQNILNYIINVAPKGDFFDEINTKFDHFLKQYNKLSSFVHGGPSAEHETFHISPPLNKTKEISESIGWTKTASRMIKFYILTLLLEETKETYKFYKELVEPLKEYLMEE
jgi:hypothetical protein